MKKKILFIAPHVSTGGLPQFLLTKIQLLQSNFQIEVIVWESNEGEYNIQAKQIAALCSVVRMPKLDNGDKYPFLKGFIHESNPDIIHFEELPELFMSEQHKLLTEIFDKKLGDYIVMCSTHTSNTFDIKYLPDHFIFPSEYCKNVMYPQFDAISTVWEEQIANHEHIKWDKPEPYNVLQVGLWAPHKNQGYSIDVVRKARELSGLEIRLHFAGNMAPNFRSYWEPLNKITLDENWIFIHGERGADELHKFYANDDLLLMPSTMELNPLVPKEALGYGMPVLISNLQTLPSWYRNNSGIGFLTGDIEQDAKAIITLLKLRDHDFERPKIEAPNLNKLYEEIEPMPAMARNVLQSIINSVKPLFKKVVETKPTFLITHRGHLKIQIAGGTGIYTVRCIDSESGKILHHAYLGPNEFTELAYNYFIPWTVEIWQNGEKVHSETLDLKGKKVYITINSNALGDTLAWIPYVSEFARKHICHVKVSTFHNNLFKGQYLDIEFVAPEEMQNDFYYHIKVGVFNPDDRYVHPNHPSIIPLQQVASDRLGLPYKEIRPNVVLLNEKPKPENPFVVICTESTTGAKEWQNKYGWQEVVDYLVMKGYDVRVVQKRPNKLNGVFDRTGNQSLHNRIGELSNASLFIGLPSGLSWLAWACNVPVMMISGFSEKWCEFEHIRVQNYSVCNSCYNNPDNKFVKDQSWCVLHKETEREYECTKNITSEMVINQLSKVLSLDHGK